MQFSELGLGQALLDAIAGEGYETPTPIQVSAIPHVLQGRDLLGCAQTGTGKTAAFALPILERLHRNEPRSRGAIRTLILTPTRELAAQIGDSFARYGAGLRLPHQVIFGGVSQRPQEAALRRRPAIVVATPGRLLDLIGQGLVDLSHLEIFVLDEADRMLDMGFVHDVKKVVARLPAKRQTLFFSATMPDEARSLASSLLTDPAEVSVVPQSTPAERIDQRVFFVDRGDKRRLLQDLLDTPEVERALVFSRTKHGANRIAEHLGKAGLSAAAIHGNKSQNARERALGGFIRGDIRVLCATDIAARGIDVEGVTHVVQYDLPNVPESYVHRIGRTARAGASGTAYAFCDGDELSLLRDIERTIGFALDEEMTHAYRADDVAQGRRASGGRGGARPGGNRGGRPPARGGERGHDRGGDRPPAARRRRRRGGGSGRSAAPN